MHAAFTHRSASVHQCRYRYLHPRSALASFRNRRSLRWILLKGDPLALRTLCCAVLWLQATGDGLGKPLHTVCFHGVAEAVACEAHDAPADAVWCCSAVDVTVVVDGVVDPSWYRAQTPGVIVRACDCDCAVYRAVFFAVPPSIRVRAVVCIAGAGGLSCTCWIGSTRARSLPYVPTV